MRAAKVWWETSSFLRAAWILIGSKRRWQSMSSRRLQQSPGIHRVEAQLLMHQTGDLTSCFITAGFQRYRRLFLSLELQGSDARAIPRCVCTTDIQVRRWIEQDYQPAAGVITAAYRAHIDSEINDQYRTHGGSVRFLNNIVRFPGCGVFDPEASFLGSSQAHEFAGGSDPVLAGEGRCWPCHSGLSFCPNIGTWALAKDLIA